MILFNTANGSVDELSILILKLAYGRLLKLTKVTRVLFVIAAQLLGYMIENLP